MSEQQAGQAKVSRRAELIGLVGPKSASLTYHGFYWQISGLVIWVVGFTALLAVSELGQPIPGYGIWIPCALLVLAELRAIQLYRQGGQAGGAFLSQQAGYAISVTGFSLQPRVWRKQMAKSTAGRPQPESAG
ncbi:MAG: hypothetical protein WA751_03280 [Candidatus Dormiibacterota bacterium]